MSHNPQYLPELATAWMAQWRRAGTELDRIRDEELKSLDDQQTMVASSVLYGDPTHEYSGLIEQQRWFMRQRILELEAKVRELESQFRVGGDSK